MARRHQVLVDLGFPHGSFLLVVSLNVAAVSGCLTQLTKESARDISQGEPVTRVFSMTDTRFVFLRGQQR